MSRRPYLRWPKSVAVKAAQGAKEFEFSLAEARKDGPVVLYLIAAMPPQSRFTRYKFPKAAKV